MLPFLMTASMLWLLLQILFILGRNRQRIILWTNAKNQRSIHSHSQSTSRIHIVVVAQLKGEKQRKSKGTRHKMAINQQNHQELKAHLMGVLGTSNTPAKPLAAGSSDATYTQTRHLISGASSVVSSSHSLSSSSTCRAESLSSSHAAALAAPPEDTKESPPQQQQQQQPLLVAAAGSVAAATPALLGHAVPTPAPMSGLDPMVLQMNAPPHPVAEFLFQLTKMLTDTNSEYIEWRHASILVHDPPVSHVSSGLSSST